MSNHNSCCANCGKPASLRCGRCAEGLDIHGIKSSTFYCDAVCQKAHWKEAHKAECKHANYRKQLYRAGLTIHELYYFTRLEAFDLKATKAEKQNGILCVEQGDYGENEILVDFPESIFTEDNDKFAMLAWNSCGEALARMHDIASAALEGCCSELEEVLISVKAGKRYIVFENGSEEARTHCIFKVNLKDGNSYALDLSGAQYGYFRTVMLWTDYMADMVAEILERRAVGSYAQAQALEEKRKRLLRKAGAMPLPLSHEDKIRAAQGNVTECVNYTVEGYAKVLETSVAKMLTENDYLSTLSILKGFVRDFVRWLKADGQAEVHIASSRSYHKHVQGNLKEARKGDYGEEVLDEVDEAQKKMEELMLE